MTSILVLGGARSGKSTFASVEAGRLARQRGRRPLLIATAEAMDDEMAERIARHRNDRDEIWQVMETSLRVPAVLQSLASEDVAVVDCLTLWLTAVMVRGEDIDGAIEELVEAVRACAGDLWLVSNEVGLGIVPAYPLGRRFRDDAGRLHQRLATAMDRVVFMIAGLAQVLKG
jgi:adenosylcobinamide kinase/adenosylcobinamide-phosphate guanylyltransferase